MNYRVHTVLRGCGGRVSIQSCGTHRTQLIDKLCHVVKVNCGRMPHTRLQVQAMAMCADGALANYRLGMLSAQLEFAVWVIAWWI